MAKAKFNLTKLTHRVVRESPAPLPIEALVERVGALAGREAPKDLRKKIRALIGQSHSICADRAGRLGWKPQMITGAVQRIVLHDEDLLERELILDELQHDLLMPSRLGSEKYGVSGPPTVELAGGPSFSARVQPRGFSESILQADPALWDWIARQGARPGDSLLLTVIDGPARRYGLSYEPAAERDEAAIAARSRELIEAATAIIRRHRGRAALWSIAGEINAGGLFHHLPAPEPFGDLWTEDVWGPLVEEYDASPIMLGGRDDDFDAMLSRLVGGPELLDADDGPLIRVGQHGDFQGDLGGADPVVVQARIDQILADPAAPVADDDPLLPAIITVMASMALPSPTGRPYPASLLVQLFGDDPETLGWIENGAELGMVAIDPAYEALFAEDEPPAPPPARSGQRSTYVLRVSYRYQPEFWREIEIPADLYLTDLHLAIQKALAWDNDHLYSFYMGRRPYERKTEIGSPWSEAPRRADRVTIGELGLRVRRKFLYLFDYGDDHLFDIQVMKTNPQAPPGDYPRVVGRQGERLVQYADEEAEEE